jgi:hypothetical protein
MSDLTLTLLLIIIIFLAVISIKFLSKIKLCALCSAVSLTWVSLTILFYLGFPINPIIIALLIGGTAAGLTNKISTMVPDRYLIFKLPFYLIFIFGAFLLTTKKFIQSSFWIVLVLLIISILIYWHRNSKNMLNIFNKIINCCKNW